MATGIENIKEVSVPVAVNATATLTAAQLLTGYITCSSTSAVTMTMPTGTALGTALGQTNVQGTTFSFIIDNTASSGSGTVTVAVGANGILSDAANTTPGSFGQLTVTVGATGVARFTVMMTGATTYCFTRTA